MKTDLDDAILWRGSGFAESSSHTLLLGIWSDPKDGHLTGWIRKWIAHGKDDPSFAVIFNALSGSRNEHASPKQREDFWAHIAFYNFVYNFDRASLGEKPKAIHYSSAKEPLRRILRLLKPSYVIVLGTKQGRYSGPVIKSEGVTYRVVPYPTSGVANKIEQLKIAWREANSMGTGQIDSP